jgi:effector-binding domain-containing protein
MSVAALLLLVGLVVGVSGRFGFFSTVEITVKDAEAMTILGLRTGGGMRKAKRIRKRLDEAVNALGIETMTGDYCAVRRDNHGGLAEHQPSDMAGYIFTGELPHNVEPLEELRMPERQVASATVRTHPRLAFAKAYPAIIRYLTKHNMVVMGPIVEISRDDGVVELQVPIEMRKVNAP